MMKLLLQVADEFNGSIKVVKVAGGNPFGNNIDFPLPAAQPQVTAAGSSDFILDFGIIRFVAYVSIFHKNTQILQFVFKEHIIPRSFDGALAVTNKRNN